MFFGCYYFIIRNTKVLNFFICQKDPQLIQYFIKTKSEAVLGTYGTHGTYWTYGTFKTFGTGTLGT